MISLAALQRDLVGQISRISNLLMVITRATATALPGTAAGAAPSRLGERCQTSEEAHANMEAARLFPVVTLVAAASHCNGVRSLFICNAQQRCPLSRIFRT